MREGVIENSELSPSLPGEGLGRGQENFSFIKSETCKSGKYIFAF
jgi:hypothetical protein